jgi:hypothetical protein
VEKIEENKNTTPAIHEACQIAALIPIIDV